MTRPLLRLAGYTALLLAAPPALPFLALCWAGLVVPGVWPRNERSHA